MTAAERRAHIVRAAARAFAESGYAGTTTEEIARLADVSQPYVIRLFGTKRQLFVATVHHACDRIEQMFRSAAETSWPDTTLTAVARHYESFLADREPLLVLLHAIAASSDPMIGDEVRDRFGRFYELVREITGAPIEEAADFIGTGLLLTALVAVSPPQP
jgi:AcrR family transcriptional regulator